MIGAGEEPVKASPLLKAGLWSPEHGICSIEVLRENWIEDAPVVAINFYRALVQSGGLQPIEKMVEALVKPMA